jgi:xylulokinase
MEKFAYTLGIDSSTLRSLSVAAQVKVRYRDDPRLAGFGLEKGQPVLAPREEGEADQPVGLFLAALDAVLSDLPRELLRSVRSIAVSAQQHGQVWLAKGAGAAYASLGLEGSGLAGSPCLSERFAHALASDRSPIWMSANTARDAGHIRAAAGGVDAMTAVSGSDSPLRFSGAVLRHRALQEPGTYAACSTVHLISSFLTSVLSGIRDSPIDWGNGSGMSLMDWEKRRWSDVLVRVVSDGLAGGAEGLRSRLPSLTSPLDTVGPIARYFTERYGIPPEAIVAAGSGDNPQTKVLAAGGLLSLGTSFVLMVDGEKPHPSANAMYDGLGSPFLFGCRTNGSLVWESVRLSHGLAAEDYSASDRALASMEPGSILRVLQRDRESFPASPPVDIRRREDFSGDYAGVVDSSLGLLWLGSRRFAAAGGAGSRITMAVTGGVSASEESLKRIAAIWECPVARIYEAGAAAGAAVSAAVALVSETERKDRAAALAAGVAVRGRLVEPDPRYVAAYHKDGGYLGRLARIME